jgi:hypothetical protein
VFIKETTCFGLFTGPSSGVNRILKETIQCSYLHAVIYSHLLHHFIIPNTTGMSHLKIVDTQYSWFKSTKSPSLCMNTIVASLTNLMGLLSQSRDCSRYVSRRLLAPPSLSAETHWPTRIRLRACLWHQFRLAEVTCPWSWRLWGISPAIHNFLIAALHFTGSCNLIWSSPNHMSAKANSFLTCPNFL